MNIDRLPKIELHLHLDCSLSYEVVQKLNPSITPEQYKKDFIAPANCADLKEYIECAAASISLMQTREQLKLVTLDLVRQLKEDHVIYAEIRFAPLQHTRQELTSPEVVEAVNEAAAKGMEETGIQAGIILCTLRHFSEAQSMETVKLVEQFKGTNIVGFDIAADETLPIGNHVKAFQYAHEHGIPCTAHSGEARGPESVWETMKKLHPQRIGHGVRSIEDESLIEFLKQKEIHLEVCPTSNVQTKIYHSLQDHHVDELYKKEVSLSINTDGRSLSNVRLADEYKSLETYFSWTKAHFLQCNQHAVEAAFTTDAIKATLHRQLIEAYGS